MFGPEHQSGRDSVALRILQPLRQFFSASVAVVEISIWTARQAALLLPLRQLEAGLVRDEKAGEATQNLIVCYTEMFGAEHQSGRDSVALYILRPHRPAACAEAQSILTFGLIVLLQAVLSPQLQIEARPRRGAETSDVWACPRRSDWRVLTSVMGWAHHPIRGLRVQA